MEFADYIDLSSDGENKPGLELDCRTGETLAGIWLIDF